MAYKVLVVDDEIDIIETLEKRLAKEGYIVCVALNGKQALLKLKEEDPDIILLDLMLPEMNGFEVLKEIRQNFKDRWRPVIIISANTDLNSIRDSYDLDADHYLTKPCEMDNVLRGIRTMISLIPLRKEEE